MNIFLRTFLSIFLLLMAIVYLPIGLWAIIAPAQDALGLKLPSFYEAVGLSVISPIGYSEFAGIYGGINIVIGIMFLIGIFKKNVGVFYLGGISSTFSTIIEDFKIHAKNGIPLSLRILIFVHKTLM